MEQDFGKTSKSCPKNEFQEKGCTFGTVLAWGFEKCQKAGFLRKSRVQTFSFLVTKNQDSDVESMKQYGLWIYQGEYRGAEPWQAVRADEGKEDTGEMYFSRKEKRKGHGKGRTAEAVKSAEEMDVPIRIDEGLYFEGKFDTEALLTMVTKKVLEPIGYDYSQIIIQYKDKVPMMSETIEEESSMGMVQGM